MSILCVSNTLPSTPSRISLKSGVLKELKNNNINYIHHSFIPNIELNDVYNKNHLFVICSQREGNPKVIIEAMATMIPILGTDVEGINSIITNEETGYLIQPDSKRIAEKIEYIFNNPEESLKLSKNAYYDCLRKYSLGIIIEKELSILFPL